MTQVMSCAAYILYIDIVSLCSELLRYAYILMPVLMISIAPPLSLIDIHDNAASSELL